MMNMYKVRIYIVVAFPMQSYDIFSNVVSVAYGKYANKVKIETTANQLITKNRNPYLMEK